jgi:hypothetical protein
MSETKTLDWRAAALFRLGEEAQAEERYADASRYYSEVLRRAEGDHEPSCFNRGVTELRLGHARDAAGIFWSLLGEKLPERLETRQLPIAFNLALARASAGELEPAFDAARSVLRCALDRDASKDQSLLRRRIAGPALAMFAVVCVRVTTLRAPSRPPDLAAVPREELLDRLRQATVPDLFEAVLAAELARDTAEEPRTQYLLACYDCLGESPELAFDELEEALTHDPGSIEWARRDPLLGPLRAADPREFRALIRWARLGRAAGLERLREP